MSESTEFDTRTLRNALGHFATGVALVTARVDGVRLAATVSSFNSVSLSPPLVLFSLARSALSFDMWRRAEKFAVMVLSSEQAEISSRFARAGSDKWQDVEVVPGINGSPLVAGALACFECGVYARYDGGDHEIIVGRVEHFETRGASRADPLIFFSGAYRSLAMGMEHSTS
ncbi:flavin reductase family protein [Pigmentiphaga kullae]|uniref:Flavin reductase (DIM6/NTAB) family NADH-FMN oxidoreductase RutF n=1 Tax=Pigmentiphaga kullae TaxID=151784 RepID=A0A4Q7NNL2_9BURK|nr:flavin reductase family protein [Pigmentiphaga kullae]RZS86598.1 flavin reductase (DIM6/NTAB) family NADH-FMN oxidoreductase RutF [Pigmentiphaga kullae]